MIVTVQGAMKGNRPDGHLSRDVHEYTYHMFRLFVHGE